MCMPCVRVSGTKPPPLSVCEGGGSFTGNPFFDDDEEDDFDEEETDTEE